MFDTQRYGPPLNAICPYFTMFPLKFPFRILSENARKGQVVLDPFCGRGTTNFAARMLGLRSIGVDASPVAVAIAAAKLVSVKPVDVVEEATNILNDSGPVDIPTGEFWEWAFHPETLIQICKIRNELSKECSSPERIGLRALMLGALHGPIQKITASYLSNQAPRTYAPKPAYSVKFWRARGYYPKNIDVIEVIERRCNRYFTDLPLSVGKVRQGDSRNASSIAPAWPDIRYDWIITSPPYYGMRTYIPDQWLRNWFLGGPAQVDYSSEGQVHHGSPGEFAGDLRQVWRNVSYYASMDAKLVVLFGGISDRKADPKQVIKESFLGSNWRVMTIKTAGNASEGKRQADLFLKKRSNPVEEFVVWARPEPLGDRVFTEAIKTIRANVRSLPRQA